MDSKQQTYQTSDLWLSVFLRASGLKLLALKREKGSKKAIFIFEDGPERLKLTKDFFDNRPLGILTVRNTFSELKSAVFNMP